MCVSLWNCFCHRICAPSISFPESLRSCPGTMRTILVNQSHCLNLIVVVHNRWIEKQTDFLFLNFFLKLFSFFHFFVCRQSFGPNISVYTCYNWCMQYVQHWTRLRDSWPLLKYVGSIASATQSVFLFVNVANLSQFIFFFCQFHFMEILFAVFFFDIAESWMFAWNLKIWLC